MKTMIWKELRENFKWAALAFLGLLVAEIYVLSTEQKDFFSSFDGFTLCGSTFLMVSSFGCAVAGTALGILQILPELHRDQWAGLLHRPVSRSVIFFGKALSGLLLYSLATVLPLLASACYVAMPRNFPAPFIPGMMLPGLSDILLGSLFYFAALLACLHRGTWFGARGVIALSIVPVFLLHQQGTLICDLPAFFILMLAAWGTLVGNGPARSMPWAGRMSSVLVKLAGILTGLVLLAAGIELVAGNGNTANTSYTKFEVARDGRVFQARWHLGGSNEGDVTDMDGKVVTDERYVGSGSYENFCRFVSLGYGLKWNVISQNAFESIFQRNIRNRVVPISHRFDVESWYLLVHENYLIGYDKLSRRCVGYFDRDGFKSPGEKPMPFSDPLGFSYLSFSRPKLITAGSKVYAVDLLERRITTFFSAQKGVVYVTANLADGNENSHTVAVALGQEIRFFDEAGKALVSLPYPHDTDRWGFLSLAINKDLDRIYLQSQKGPYWNDRNSGPTPDFLDEFDLHGKLLHSYSYTAPAVSTEPFQWVAQMIDCSAPLGVMLATEIYSRIEALSNPGRMAQNPPLLTSGQWLLLPLIGLALAASAFLWARKAGFSMGESLRWAAFVFVFGPAGLLTFRLAADWPVQVRCPSCSLHRAVESEQCPGCREHWILPKPTGSEIFE